MGTDRLEYKMGIIDLLGEKLGRLHASTLAKIPMEEHKGIAFKEASKAIEGLFGHIDKDAEEGKVSEEERKLLKAWIKRAVGLMDNMALGTVANRTAAIYRAQGMLASMKIHEQEHDLTAKKRGDIKEALDQGHMVPEEDSTPLESNRSRPSIKRGSVASRRAEAALEKPLPDYDNLTVAKIRLTLGTINEDTMRAVLAYEEANKARKGLISTLKQQLE